MLMQKVLGEDIASVAAQTALIFGVAATAQDARWLPGQKVVGVIHPSPNFNATMLIQGSDDGTNWTTLLTVTGTNQQPRQLEITLQAYMRSNMTVFTAGEASAYLMIGS